MGARSLELSGESVATVIDELNQEAINKRERRQAHLARKNRLRHNRKRKHLQEKVETLHSQRKHGGPNRSIGLLEEPQLDHPQRGPGDQISVQMLLGTQSHAGNYMRSVMQWPFLEWDISQHSSPFCSSYILSTVSPPPRMFA